MNLDYLGETYQEYGWSFDYQREHDYVYLPSGNDSLDFIYDLESSDEIKTWVDQTNQGLQKSELRMERIEGDEAGIGGTYYCTDQLGKRRSVFKPFDEEARAPHNTHSDRRTTGPIEGTKAGKGAAREIAAYLLDHPTKSVGREGFVGQFLGFCGVPPTVPVWCLSNTLNWNFIPGKVGKYTFGSLQNYMESNGNCVRLDDGVLEDYEVQKICLLDIRFANADRHFGNLLYRKEDNGTIKLIPIDHGYCFPENFKACKFHWLNWKKSKNMFNPEIIEYIESLHAGEDIKLLMRNGFRMSYKFARTLHISTMVLKEGVKKGLSPFEIGHFMCNEELNLNSRANRRIYSAISSLASVNESGEILSVLQKTVSDSVRELIGVILGNEFVTNEEIAKEVEEVSKLRSTDMTKQQVEDALLEIVSANLRSKIDQYANLIRE